MKRKGVLIGLIIIDLLLVCACLSRECGYIQDVSSAGIKIGKAEENVKKVALTFDDGPSSHTAQILQSLTKYHAKATFFVNGDHVIEYPTVIEDIFANGNLEKASLGIESSTFIDERSSQMFRVSSGLFVYTLTEGGAAEEAGIERGDIIISVNGTALTDEASLENILADLKPGDVVKVEVVRNRDPKNVVTVDVTLDGILDAGSKLPSQAE